MRIEFQIEGEDPDELSFTRDWPMIPRIGDVVNLSDAKQLRSTQVIEVIWCDHVTGEGEPIRNKPAVFITLAQRDSGIGENASGSKVSMDSRVQKELATIRAALDSVDGEFQHQHPVAPHSHAVVPAACRRCVDCEGQEHHLLDDGTCKHCEAQARYCGCGGLEDCLSCAGMGWIFPQA